MLCNERNLKWPPQKATLSDPILVKTAVQQLFKPSTPPLTYSLSSSPPPPSFPPHHILASLAFTRLLLPIFLSLFLPHFLPFYRMGRTNPRIQSETQDLSTAGLLLLTTSRLPKTASLLRILLIPQDKHVIFGNYFNHCRLHSSLLHLLTGIHWAT